VPVKNKKELIKEKEDNKLYSTSNISNIDEERIEKLRKIDNFIRINSEMVEEELVNIKVENRNLNKGIDMQVIKSLSITSTAIEEYISSELRNNSQIFNNKIIDLEKEKYFEAYKEEHSELVKKVFTKYPDLHKEINKYFNQNNMKFPGFGEFIETTLYFAFVRKMEEEEYFNVDFVPGLCNNLTINQLIVRKEVYKKSL
jgi:hypothetical protein